MSVFLLSKRKASGASLKQDDVIHTETEAYDVINKLKRKYHVKGGWMLNEMFLITNKVLSKILK